MEVSFVSEGWGQGGSQRDVAPRDQQPTTALLLHLRQKTREGKRAQEPGKSWIQLGKVSQEGRVVYLTDRGGHSQLTPPTGQL